MKRRLSAAAVVFLVMFPAAVVAEEANTVLWLGHSAKVAKGAFLIERGDVHEGIRLTRKALEEKLSFHDQAAALNNLCTAKLALRQLRDAIDHCTTAVKIGHRLWQGYNNRGNAYYLLGNYDAAISDYERGLAIRPESGILKLNMRMAVARKARKGPPIVEEWES